MRWPVAGAGGDRLVRPAAYARPGWSRYARYPRAPGRGPTPHRYGRGGGWSNIERAVDGRARPRRARKAGSLRGRRGRGANEWPRTLRTAYASRPATRRRTVRQAPSGEAGTHLDSDRVYLRNDAPSLCGLEDLSHGAGPPRDWCDDNSGPGGGRRASSTVGRALPHAARPSHSSSPRQGGVEVTLPGTAPTGPRSRPEPSTLCSNSPH